MPCSVRHNFKFLSPSELNTHTHVGTTAPLKIETETSTEDSPDSGTVLGSIHLPPALFLALSEELTEVGVWFSLHKRGSFFPLPDDATVNDSVSTPVISATVGGHAVHGLLEPVLFSLQLLNRVSCLFDLACFFLSSFSSLI